MTQGDKNHQYGLTGDKNASFKSGDRISNYGYILEYCPDHPYHHDRSNKCPRVLQHRLVIERNYTKFPKEYFEEINNMIVLKQEYIVHHKDENKQNNDLNNLEILTKGEHSSLHNKTKFTTRDKRGRIVGVSKSGKIGESCDANTEVNE